MQLPEQFKLKYQQLLGAQATAFFNSFDQPVNHAFRINPLKQALPTEVDLSHPVPHCQWGYYGKVNGKSVDHQSGAVYSQEPSAMYVGEVAAPKTGMKVLDLCAAPGGKSTHLASFLANTGLLVSNEINHKRAKVLVENLERFGAQNTMILNETPQNLRKHFPGYFDQILVDAPCSGEGMFHKDPDAMQYWNLDYPSECAVRQREILRDAVQMLTPGGELVYSTCTFAPEEDEQIIAWLLDEYPLEMVPIKKYDGMVAAKPEWANGNPAIANAVRLFPHLFKGEGHFIAKLRLTQAIKSPKKVKVERRNLSRDQQQLWDDFISTNIDQFTPTELICFGDQLYTLNPKTPQLKGLKVMRPGLLLGTFKKKRFEPSYALALAIQPQAMKKTVQIDHHQWAAYVHGDTFQVVTQSPLTKGWYQLICNQQAIGFGKNVNGTIKNFFPKGLRFSVK
ncbi:RsmF rRNA methyltransferase first C-terminal domain-containing protein [Nicoliella spurrieriana]|uniref:RsmF rRNA methyltransferase first C-terminal domain-containing protein n=1 Tax=Nicoliella spurrieriana TaxID=2925830 RepID=A0A976RRS3_9LACO|nr:RsmF rRNA methyltransferase first C-terminal domain-containing protein [Nicoliella spurrieriana]UQS86618.1 RsmF rRNA methyltransferase first C-terminal domain-containing protein [Nicoliella spurrieriana]